MKTDRRRRLREAERLQVVAERRATDAAAEARRLRAALDILPVGVVVADADGSVVFRNRRGTELVADRSADVLVSQAVSEVLAEARHSGPQERTLELHGPPRRTLVVSAHPIGDHLGTVAVSEDISSRRQLEATRRDFVANVSHELRTPVGALTVLTEALVGQEDPETTRRLAGRIAEETERLGRIIEDLLDLSRLEGEAGERGIQVPVASVVAGAVDRVEPLASKHDVTVRTRKIPVGTTVRGDESQLVSALANLLDNAVKYSEAGSRVDLKVKAEDGWVAFVVRDRGIGIPTRELERIFERFYRVDRARSRHTGGTGLGLAIVRHVATNHGGEVSVESREGVGSTFVLRLPASSS